MIVFQSNVIKVKKKSFTRYIGVARLLIGGEGETANHMQWRSQNFLERGTFYGTIYRKMEDQKLGPGVACNLDFAKGKGHELKVKKLSKIV